MDLLPLLSVLIVIVGFALKFDAILIVMAALIVTTLIGGLGLALVLETLGAALVDSRGMAIFIIIMLVTGTLERDGLKELTATLIERFKKVSVGVITDIYGVFRIIFAAFNVSLGGAAGFMRPIILPMALGIIESKDLLMVPEYEEKPKGMASAMENICWFFGQVLFVGGAGVLPVQSTLKDLGYEVTLGKLALAEAPVVLVASISTGIHFTLEEERLRKKHYGQEGLK